MERVNCLRSDEIAKEAARVLNDKKAADISVLNISEITIMADYFVICTANSVPQVKALTDELLKKLDEKGVKALRVEGLQSATWVLLDFGSVIVHIFKGEVRDFYNLDRLWGDAKQEKYDFLNI